MSEARPDFSITNNDRTPMVPYILHRWSTQEAIQEDNPQALVDFLDSVVGTEQHPALTHVIEWDLHPKTCPDRCGHHDAPGSRCILRAGHKGFHEYGITSPACRCSATGQYHHRWAIGYSGGSRRCVVCGRFEKL